MNVNVSEKKLWKYLNYWKYYLCRSMWVSVKCCSEILCDQRGNWKDFKGFYPGMSRKVQNKSLNFVLCSVKGMFFFTGIFIIFRCWQLLVLFPDYFERERREERPFISWPQPSKFWWTERGSFELDCWPVSGAGLSGRLVSLSLDSHHSLSAVLICLFSCFVFLCHTT